MINFLVLFISTFFLFSFSINNQNIHRRPMPGKVETLDPTEVKDVFSYSAIFLIHATLFKKDAASSSIENYLVKNFNVSNDGMTYNFELGNFYFHNEKKLTTSHVVDSLMHAFIKRIVDYESFYSIKGLEEYISNNSSLISGLKIESDTIFKIELTRRDPQLLSKLADIKFSIWSKKYGPKIGVGKYKLKSWEPNKIILSKSIQNNKNEGGPDIVELHFSDKENAIKLFNKGEYDDLFFYSIFDEDLDQINIKFNLTKFYFPKSYTIVLNSKKINNQKIRKEIINSLNTNAIINACYKGEKEARDLIPPGYLGHQNKNTKKEVLAKKNHIQLQSFIFSIAYGVGNENCIKEHLAKEFSSIFSKNTKINIEIVNIGNFINQWSENKIMGGFIYLEADRSNLFFGAFSPNTTFTYGNHLDQNFSNIYQTFNTELDKYKKHDLASNLAEHILNQHTTTPIFHHFPKLVYSKRYSLKEVLFTSPAMTEMSFFIESKGK